MGVGRLQCLFVVAAVCFLATMYSMRSWGASISAPISAPGIAEHRGFAGGFGASEFSGRALWADLDTPATSKWTSRKNTVSNTTRT